MKKILVFWHLMFLQNMLFAQKDILVIGNSDEICFDSSYNVNIANNLDDLLSYDIALIFSGVSSRIKKEDFSNIIEFVSRGGGLYLGCENWPFQAETNQILDHFFSFQSWGNFQSSYAKVSDDSEITELKEIPTGNSVTVFPMNSNFKVDVWLDDNPIVMSGDFNNGRIVVDGGYSRFYCSEINETSKMFFLNLMKYLGSQ